MSHLTVFLFNAGTGGTAIATLARSARMFAGWAFFWPMFAGCIFFVFGPRLFCGLSFFVCFEPCLLGVHFLFLGRACFAGFLFLGSDYCGLSFFFRICCWSLVFIFVPLFVFIFGTFFRTTHGTFIATYFNIYFFVFQFFYGCIKCQVWLLQA